MDALRVAVGPNRRAGISQTAISNCWMDVIDKVHNQVDCLYVLSFSLRFQRFSARRLISPPTILILCSS